MLGGGCQVRVVRKTSKPGMLFFTIFAIYLVTSCNYFFDHSFWGPARHTQHAISRLGSSTPHWTRTIAVGVQHATLNLQCRGWGPARHTKLIRSRLGSSTPHRTHKIAVGVQHATLNWENASCNCGPARHTERRESQLIEEDDKGQEDDDEGGEGGEGEEGEEGGEGEGGGEESDIKSNNPHLTGGEKHCGKQALKTRYHTLLERMYHHLIWSTRCSQASFHSCLFLKLGLTHWYIEGPAGTSHQMTP